MQTADPIEYRGFTFDVLESDDPEVPYQFGVIVQKDGDTVYIDQARTAWRAARAARCWIDSNFKKAVN